MIDSALHWIIIIFYILEHAKKSCLRLKILVEEFYSIMQLTLIFSLVFIGEGAEIVPDCDTVVNRTITRNVICSRSL